MGKEVVVEYTLTLKTAVLPLDGVSYVLVVGEDVFVGFLKPPSVV